ncbi:hypothetical protein [Salinibacter ruber]|jgi:hypothetical protein|uniref:Uncharacterized protein n=1 Tax=Salinibacter ruber TaxID=146919 RepID=A0AAW5PCT2_9BACT|nr:hypothetical protein [Salinibacter ruber]MCS4159259.1 hypothetical protein [Salinibacter ruber]MCS4223743.1 hypothetical protein [Salinibacter ruber]
MDNHPNVNALLDTLEAALSEDASDDGIETGFRETSPEGESQYLFLNRQSFDYGHMLDDDQNPIRPPARCVAGHVEDVSHFTRTNDYGTSHKLRLRVETGEGTIMIETGFFTNTSKSLLSDLAEIENPNSILTIEPTLPDERRGGNSQNVLFTDLHEGTEAVISQRYPDTDQDVIDTFKEVRQDVFGLPPQEDDAPRLPNNGGGGQQGGGAPPRQQPNQRRQGGQQRQQQPRQASNGQPRQASNGQPQQGGQRNGRQPQQGAQPQQGGQPQQGAQQGGQQQPNQAPPSRDGTAQTPNTPPHTA